MSIWQEKNLFLQGPVGQLQAILMHDERSTFDEIALICHPHPLFGGTMQNKVVTTLVRTFRDLNIPSLRFNYRGVGKSVGDYDKGMGETDDALAIIAWIQQEWPGCRLWLSGFSFGAFVSLRTADILRQQKTLRLKHLISIAPAIHHADFSSLYPDASWLIVQGGKDDVVPAEEVIAWTKTLPPPAELLFLPTANHFFDGELVTLRQQLQQSLLHAHTH